MSNCTVVGDLNQRPVPIDLLSAEPMRKFEAAILRTGHATFLVYKTGKVVCVGAANPDVASEEFQKLPAEIHRRLDANAARISTFLQKSFVATLDSVSNVVCHGGFNQSLRLDRVYDHFRYHPGVIYEPELYPALKLDVKGATLLLFTSGKVIITGAKDIKQAEAAYLELCHHLIPLSDRICLTSMPGKPLAPLALQDVKRKSPPSSETSSSERRKKRNAKSAAAASSKDSSQWSTDDWIELFKADLVKHLDEEAAAAAKEAVATDEAEMDKENKDPNVGVHPASPQPPPASPISPPFEPLEPSTSKVAVVEQPQHMDCHVYPFDLGAVEETSVTTEEEPRTSSAFSPVQPSVSSPPFSNHEAAVTMEDEQVQLPPTPPIAAPRQVAKKRLPLLLVNSKHRHLGLVSYVMCKSCKGRAQVHPNRWLEDDEGRFQVGLSLCANCLELNRDWYETVCM